MRWFPRPSILLLLIYALGAHAWPISFRVHMDRLLEAGRMRVPGDQVLVRGSFNGWAGDSGLMQPGSIAGEYQVTLDLPAAWQEWKFVLRTASGCEEWESLPFNRSAWLTASPAPVWFANDSSAVLPPAPLDLHFTVELAQARRMGIFDPARHQVGVVGAGPELGCWSTPIPLVVEGERASGWLRHSGLSSQVLAWKAVLWEEGQAGTLVWEGGANRLLRRVGDEEDALPLPFGDGVAELELPAQWWGQAEGWAPGPVLWGADLSMVPRLRQAGAQWSRDGQTAEPLALFRQSGWQVARLRLWHSPQEDWHGLDSTLAHAQRARQAGFDVLLDFHYSDTWGDPGHQSPPAAWAGLPLTLLVDSLRQYTRRTLERFVAAGASPRWVQLGNEIDAGMLWPTGRVDGAWNTPAQWSQLATLLQAASQGVADAFPAGGAPSRLIHLSSSGSSAACRRTLDSLVAHGLPFEAIGLSYYPWWHGSPEQLQATLDELALRYGRELLIVETAHPFTLGWADDVANFVGEEGQLPDGFAASPAGQLAFLEMLQARLQAVPLGLGRALLPWEAAWIPASGVEGPWENLALFAFNGQALPALDAPAYSQPAPPHLQVAITPAAQVRLSWTPMPGAATYRVRHAPTPNGPWSTVDTDAQSPWLSPLSAGAGYYRVSSVGTVRVR